MPHPPKLSASAKDHDVHPIEQWVLELSAIAQAIVSTSTTSRTERLRSIVQSVPHSASRAHELVLAGLLLELTLGRRSSDRSGLLAHLDRLSTLAPCESPRGIADRIARRIANRFAEPLDIRRLAREQGIDESSLRRNFKREFGITPREYHLRCRVRIALDLLRATDDKITVIARHVGYRDEKNFFRAVSRFTGRTPSQLRTMPEDDVRAIVSALIARRPPRRGDCPGATHVA